MTTTRHAKRREKRVRMWGVFDGEHCVAAFMWRQAAESWVEMDTTSREVIRPITVTYSIPSPKKPSAGARRK